MRGAHYAPCAITGEDEDPFHATHIPVYRMVVDLGDLRRSRIVNSVGQSGHRASPHYDDQLEVWAAGRLLPMLWDRRDVARETVATLRLRAR